MEEIKVRVTSYGPQRCLSMYYTDPVSGKRVVKSTKTRDPGEAEREAGEWQRQLRAGLYQSPSKITWDEFVERYTSEHLSTLSPQTKDSAIYSLAHVKRGLNPDRICKLTTPTMSKFAMELRKQGMRETTLGRHLRHIHAALAWAVSMGMLAKVPDMKIFRGGSSRGRGLSTEEFERLLTACEKIRPQDALQWQRYITGLWLSGLRRGESIILSWDDDSPFAVDLSGRHPRFRIYGKAQKSRKDETLPLMPDFAQWLLDTFPESERQGKVFKLDVKPHRVGEILSKIGKKAGVVVNKADGKFATAHDLRRSFGTRWAKKVMPAVLQRLMRHANITTTMKYYVTLDADELADELWADHAPKADSKAGVYNNCYNTRPETAENEITVPAETSTETVISKHLGNSLS
jgi:integrase